MVVWSRHFGICPESDLRGRILRTTRFDSNVDLSSMLVWKLDIISITKVISTNPAPRHTLTTMISKAGIRLHASLIDAVLRYICIAVCPFSFWHWHSADLLYLTKTDSGIILNRQAPTYPVIYDIVGTNTMTKQRFSQDVEVIDGELPEALVDFFAS